MKPVLIVHAGAWSLPSKLEKDHIEAMNDAIHAGSKVLQTGGTAKDAVQATVESMEQSGKVNAGIGGVLNEHQERELDAMIMGSDFSAGAVTGIAHTTHAVRLARTVMDHTPHAFIAGTGAEKLRQDSPAEKLPKHLKSAEALLQARREFGYGDTVGAVALDKQGNLAAATSTGGTPDKLQGRIGDSPVVGCGGYACPWAACSTTGHGEALMKITAAKTACEFVRQGVHPLKAAENTVRELEILVQGKGGLILLDAKGNHGIAFNTPAISVGIWNAAETWTKVLRKVT